MLSLVEKPLSAWGGGSALTERSEPVTGRPDVCEDVEDDGEQEGWFAENGDGDIAWMMKDGAET